MAADQEIIEVETDKAVMGVTTPCAGVIAKIDAEVKGTYAVGAVLGLVEASEADAARFRKTRAGATAGLVAKEVPGRQEEDSAPVQAGNGSGSHFQVDEAAVRSLSIGSNFQADAGGGLPVPAGAKGAGYMSPRMRARMAELQLTRLILPALPEPGRGGRVTVKDLENFLGETRTAPGGGGERDSHGSRRCDAAQLDTSARNGRRFRLPRSGAGGSGKTGSETRSALYVLRALALALAENPTAAARFIGGRAIRSESMTSAWRWKQATELWFRSSATRTKLHSPT